MSKMNSLELRWFFPGSLSTEVDAWFHRKLPGPPTGEPDRRSDIYLFQPRHEEFGIKLRQKKKDNPFSLEIKWRGLAKPFKGSHGTEGQVEQWIKWGWDDPAGPNPRDIASLYIPDGPWVTIGKTRWQRKYQWGNGAFTPVPADYMLPLGAAVEMTFLELKNRTYSTFLLETFAQDLLTQEKVLDAAVEYLWREYPIPAPKADQSCGYPAWLRKITGA